MKFEVAIPDAELRALVERLVRNQFADMPDRGAGLAVLRRLVVEAVERSDFAPMIAETFKRLVPGIVEDVCADRLRAKIRETAKDMAKRGDLPLFEAKS